MQTANCGIPNKLHISWPRICSVPDILDAHLGVETLVYDGKGQDIDPRTQC